MQSPFRLPRRATTAAPNRPPAVPGWPPEDDGPELDFELPDDLDDTEALADEPSGLVDEALQEIAEQSPYGEVLLDDLIRRQLRLAVSVAAVFGVVLFGLPLMNLAFSGLMQMHVLGLPMSWLALALLIYPFVWVLAWYFVVTSRKYEEEFTDLLK